MTAGPFRAGCHLPFPSLPAQQLLLAILSCPRQAGPLVTLILLWSRRPQEKLIRWWAQSRKQCPQAPDEFQLSVQKQFCCLSSSSRHGEGPSQILSVFFGRLPCPAVLLTGWSFSCRKISLARMGENLGGI